MDLTKAQRLLNKIQAFLDNGNTHELSRLEKDLIKSYVQQLYEAVTSDDTSFGQEPEKLTEVTPQKNYKSESTPKVDPPTPRVTEPPKPEPINLEYPEYVAPVYHSEPKMYTEQNSLKQEKSVNKEEIKPDFKSVPVVETAKQEIHHEPIKESIPVETNTEEFSKYGPVKEALQTPKHVPSHGQSDEALLKLFDVQKSDEVGSRFSHVPIVSIESAMGLNERIFTLNELFGGDKGLFDAWCSKLNSLNSFAEAKNVLLTGPAKDFKWSDPERIKMAEQFIRIVSRRYPKAVS